MSCPDCFSGAIRNGKPQGHEETLHNVRTYVAGAAQSKQSSKATIIIITDAFGFNLVNTKLLADVYATKTQYKVVIPDIIPGGGVPADSLELMSAIQKPVAWYDIFGQVRRIWTAVRMVSRFLPFAIRSRKAYPGILEYVRSTRAAMAAGEKLGVAGFCWGAMQTAKLAQEATIEHGEAPLVSAHFMAHPSGLKPPQDIVSGIKKFNVPCSIALGGRDMMLSKDKADELEAALRTTFPDSKDSLYELEVYEKCGHGFAVRADSTKPDEDDAAEKAADQAAEWFKKHLA